MTDNFKNDSDKNEGVLELINSSTEIVGGTVVGLATGLLTGDPALAAVLGAGGKAIEIAFRMIGNEFYERVIGPREKVRAGAAMSLAVAGIRKRLENGESPREDDFFEKTPTNRSNFEEVIESTLKKVMDTTEEPKIKFMANLTENIVFEEDLDMDTYRQILKSLDELSYRQLCIIKLISLEDQKVDIDSIDTIERVPQNKQTEFYSISRDYRNLMDNHYIIGSSIPTETNGDDPFVSNPGSGWLPGNTKRLDRFANLDDIPFEDIKTKLSIWNVRLRKPEEEKKSS